MTHASLSLFDWAAHRRDAGMIEAEFAETLVNPDFSDDLYAAICHVARRQLEVHADDVLRLLKTKPSHPNAAGIVWRRAIKDGVISHSGRVRPCVSDPVKRVHLYPIYTSGLFFGRKSA